MTGIGVVLFLVIVGGVVVCPRRYVWVVILMAPFHDNAVFVSGRVTVSPYFSALLVLVAIRSYYRLRERAERRKASSTVVIDTLGVLLASLFIYSCLITILGPSLFSGTPVAVAGAGLDEQVGRLSALDYSASNAAQTVYLALNIFLVFHIFGASSNWKLPLRIALILGVAVASTDVIALLGGLEWPHFFFDSDSRISANLAKVAVRARGQFSEPSHLAAFAMAAAVYLSVDSWRSRPGWGRRSSLAGSVLAVVCLFSSASGTALIGAIVAGCVMMVIVMIRVLALGRVNVGFVASASVLLVSAPLLTVYLAQVVRDMVAKKAATGSYRNRGYADANSIEVFYRTSGLGSGLGSNRGSSLLLMLLSTVGIVGAALFLLVLVRLTFRLIRPQVGVLYTPANWALLAYAATLLISYADFASAVLWILIACCYADCRPPVEPRRNLLPVEAVERRGAGDRGAAHGMWPNVGIRQLPHMS